MPFATGKRSRWATYAQPVNPDESNPFDTTQVQRQIENARTRLTDAGVNVDVDTDKRNWFEKLTNLPQGQNWFFDTLELLGRPGQAVLNAIDKGDSDGTPLNAAWRGFSGQERTHGSDLVEKAGVDNKYLKAILGTGVEIVADPTTYIPGAVFAKGASLAGRGVAAAGRGVLEGTERLIPQFGRLSEEVLRPGAQRAKDALGYAFNRDYKIDETLSGETDDFLRNLTRQTEDTRRFLQEESLKNVTDAAKVAGGVETGADVGRIMESPLKQSRSSDELLQSILSGRKLTFNVVDGELQQFINRINRRILTSPAVRRRRTALEKQLENIRKRKDAAEAALKKASTPTRRDSLLEKIDDYGEAEVRVNRTLNELTQGVVVRKNDYDVFEVFSANPALNRRAIGDQRQFIDNISRKGAFEDVVKPEFKAALQPIAERLLREGVVITKNLKGTPEQRELKRLFGSNIGFRHDKKGRTRIELKQRDPDKMYFGLKDAKPVIPEELTNANVTKDPTGLEFGDIQFMDRLDNVEIPRAVRELSDNQAIQEAANQLIRSNNELRQYARDNGIHISELEGYMKHVLSKAEREARARGRVSRVDRGSRNKGNPNKNVIKQRELTGSVEDVNERMDTGRPFFEPNAYFATAIGQKQLIDYVQAVQFRRKVLSNPEFAVKYEKGMDIGPNQVVIDTNNYKFIKEGDDAPGVADLASEIGGQYLVTKSVKNALDRYQTLTTDEGTRAMLKAYDKVLTNWKKLALLSPLYHVRNLAGAMFNNYVGGMNTPNLIKYTTSAFQDVVNAAKGKETELFREYRGQGLGAESMSNIEFLRTSEPEAQVERMVKRKSQTGMKKAVSKLNLTETSRETGDFMDQANRFALYKWMRDKGATPEQAAAKVREVQFDYTKTSPFEQQVMTRIVPFYRWMRNNIPFQLKQLVSDPRKYANVNKIRTNAQDAMGLDDENIPDFMKENFAIPVTGDEEKGTGKYLGLNLPLGDLTKLADPLKLFMDAVASPIKLPAELALNRNFFQNKPIQKFEGQQVGYDLPGSALDFGLNPYLAHLIEQLGGQPARFASNAIKDKEDVDQQRRFSEAALGISSPLKPYDANKDEYYNLLVELQKLQDYMKYIEQQTGQPVRTLRDIQSGLR